MTGSVPPLDLTDPEVIRDPYPHLAALREHAPFVWHEGLQAHVASGHAEVSAALDAAQQDALAEIRDGQGAGPPTPMHCDVVVSDQPGLVQAIGGNVRDAVVLRRLPCPLSSSSMLHSPSPFQRLARLTQ